jgi:hypothetical protein
MLVTQDPKQTLAPLIGCQILAMLADRLYALSIRPKAVVDAELHSGDGLLDVNPWQHFGDTENCPGQR